jgi:hypothetical protein
MKSFAVYVKHATADRMTVRKRLRVFDAAADGYQALPDREPTSKEVVQNALGLSPRWQRQSLANRCRPAEREDPGEAASKSNGCRSLSDTAALVGDC